MLLLSNLMDKRSFDGVSFVGGAIVGSSSGNYSMGQLFNPAASGKILVVRRLVGFPENASSIDLRRYDTELSGGTAVVNKMVDGEVGKAKIRSQTGATRLGTFLCALDAGARSAAEFITAGPMLLAAGMGLLVTPVTTTTQLTVMAEWEELDA